MSVEIKENLTSTQTIAFSQISIDQIVKIYSYGSTVGYRLYPEVSHLVAAD